MDLEPALDEHSIHVQEYGQSLDLEMGLDWDQHIICAI
jgi:hypothetical protein